MKRKNTTQKTIHHIKSMIDIDVYSMADFYSASPYEIDELVKLNRLSCVANARHIAIAWCLASGLSMQKTCNVFERSHASIINSVKVVESAVTNPTQYPEIIAFIDRIRNYSRCISVSTNGKEVFSLVNMENRVFKTRLLKYELATNRVA